MAVDTRKKRASALVVTSWWTPPAPTPDGAFDTADRQQIGWGYVGIPVGSAVVATLRRPHFLLRGW